MATKVTSKKPNFANSRSHANNSSTNKQKPNLQKFTINGVKVITSAHEAKTFKKSQKGAVEKLSN